MDATERSHLPDSRLYSSAEWAKHAVPLPALPHRGRVRRARPLAFALAAVAFGATLAIAASNAHTPAQVTVVPAVRAMLSGVPYVAAAMAAFAIFRPWSAYLLILLLTPVWDAAQVSWYTNGFQITMQTVLVVALGVGCVVSCRRGHAAEREAMASGSAPDDGARKGLLRKLAVPLTIRGVAGLALIAFVGLAVASTYSSRSVGQSGLVLIHGLIEPIAMGLILLALRPNRIGLALVAIALGVSAAIGSMINIVQTVPGAKSLAMLQAQRFSFSQLTYGNVGFFGELLAMAVPLLIGVMLARRSLRLQASTSVLLVAALAACLAGLFLTFSKSAWLATSIAATLLVLLASRGWRSRAAIVLTAGLLSTVVVPWPALVLQFTPSLDSEYRTIMVRIVGGSRFDSWNPATVAGQGSVTFRVRTVEAGLHMAVDHPLLGVGLNQYHRYYMAGYAVGPIDKNINHAHSIWPELAAELGFPAMGLVALIYTAALLALWRVYRNPPDSATRMLAAAFIAAVVAWVIVATAFGTDIYRSPRNSSSEIVMMAVVTAAAFALAGYSRAAMARLGPAQR